MPSTGNGRPAVLLIWVLVIAVALLGGWKLLHLTHHSHDQQILIDKSKH